MAKSRKKKTKKRYSSWLVIVAALVIASFLHQTINGRKLPTFQQVTEQSQNVVQQATKLKERITTNNESKANSNEVKAPLTEQAFETPKNRPLDTRVMSRAGYTLSFNDEWLMPNWVAWQLTPERLMGKEKRTDEFTGDPNLPEHLRVEHRDYSRSGYDRGHMAPAADMKWDKLAMQESFYMSNICPQASNLNKGDWKELEEQCRKWTQNHHTTIYIACGPIVHPGEKHKRIGQGHKVIVPDGFFKVVLKLGKTPAAVGFIYPNDDCNAPMNHYAIPVDSVEALTGIDFFHLVPNELENVLEATNGFEKF